MNAKEETQLLQAILDLVEEVGRMKDRIAKLEERKPETHVHNHYHNEPGNWQPSWQTLRQGTGEPYKPPFEVTCGG
jgi:hypothetical protein